MNRIRRAVLTALVSLPFVSLGCLKCHHTAYRECLRPVEHVGALAPARAKVHVFLMNGVDVVDRNGLKELECAIVEGGFPKVYYAQRFDIEWYYKELHRLRREDPDHRFILVGQGAAAKQLQELACRVTNDNIPLDAVVYLDPIGVNTERDGEQRYPSHVIQSQRWINGPRVRNENCNTVTRIGRREVCEHPAASAIIALLIASASEVPVENPPIDCIPLLDENKPIPRPSEPKQVPLPSSEWNILCPNSGHG